MLFKILCCLILSVGGTMTHRECDNIREHFNYATEIVLYDDGRQTKFLKGDQKFEELLSSLEEITKDSHDMPAFGVSLDKETRKAIKSGFWIELEFDGETSHNEMPFESLLIEVVGDFSGFNIIRKHNGKYDGRCFYLQLMSNMQPLFDKVQEISKNN